MRQRHREIFTTIKTEGNLLPIDLLHRIAEGDNGLKGLTPDSYHLTKSERLNEVINRAWNRCEGVWRSFQSDAASLPETDAGTTLTRERWLLPFFQELEYGRLLTSKAQEIERKTYPISHAWHHTPIHLVTFRQDLDRRTPGVAGAARMSPHSLVQEFLNRSDDNLWGMVSNGLRLRLLRDNASLTRQAYVEFDLEGMMSGEVYSDFILLFLLLHQSRVEAERPEQCWLERWTQEAQRQGTRALDHLRGGVEQAIATLGQGFLAHPSNTSLRQKLQSGDLASYDLYQQLLRLVYRMIFLFVAEDRNLLLLPDAPAEARGRYLDHYSITRIRRLAGRLRGTRHADIWKGLKITFRCLAAGEPALGIDPLGGFLFSENAISDLNDCELSNDALLTAVRHLSFTQDNKTLRPVDYRNLGTEELGSVYESLLELHPEINVSASTFDLKIAAGSERKTTGSYYTPSSLINCLLDSALEPVIARALKESNSEKALLDLKVVDPACGSGHFLISAAHRIGKHLAMIRTGEVEPPPEQRRKALRDVVSHCIYGVDVNPLAVELCKVALWIETLDPGRPLGFLDHHIKCGNSLIGATPELLEKGIPDDAFKPVVGDDKKIASAIRKKNREERKGQQDLFAEIPPESEWQEAVEDFQQWGSMPEHSFHEVCDKAAQYETLQDKPAYRHEKQVADLWTASFFWTLTEETGITVPTEDIFRRFQGGDYELKDEARKRMESIATKHRFFHWHLEFPEVYTDKRDKGFDCVLSNPPWERIRLEEQEWFSERRPDIASAPNARIRADMTSKLKKEDSLLYAQFLSAKRIAELLSKFLRNSGCFPLCGRGDINTSSVFAEQERVLISPTGYVGCIVPTGIATDDTTKIFFNNLMVTGALASLIDFSNEEGLFPSVRPHQHFCLLIIQGSHLDPVQSSRFAFFLTNTVQLAEEWRSLHISYNDIVQINPNSKTLPLFPKARDAEIAKAIYSHVPILVRDGNPEVNLWDVRFLRMFDMTNDSDLFEIKKNVDDDAVDPRNPGTPEDPLEYLPLFDAKMAQQYNHRAAKLSLSGHQFRKLAKSSSSIAQLMDPYFSATPVYWVSKKDVSLRLGDWQYDWLLGFKDVTGVTSIRLASFSIIPRCGVSNKYPLMFAKGDAPTHAHLLTVLNSIIIEYILRLKMQGLSLNYFLLKQVPVPSPNVFQKVTPWEHTSTIGEWFVRRALELSYTSWDLKSFAMDCGYGGPPFLWDENRRFLMRCEIDAGYFHIYGINRDSIECITDALNIIKRNDMKKHAEYRTEAVILECYDAMAEAIKTGRPYQTILDPPPADPFVAHPPRNEDT